MGQEYASSELTVLAYILPPRAIISRATLSVEDQLKALKEGSRTLQAPAISICLNGALSFYLVGGQYCTADGSRNMQDRFRWAVLVRIWRSEPGSSSKPPKPHKSTKAPHSRELHPTDPIFLLKSQNLSKLHSVKQHVY